MQKGETSKMQIARGLILRSGLINRVIHADQFRQLGRHNGRLVPWPQIELAFLGIQHPLARLVEFFQRVLYPAAR